MSERKTRVAVVFGGRSDGARGVVRERRAACWAPSTGTATKSSRSASRRDGQLGAGRGRPRAARASAAASCPSVDRGRRSRACLSCRGLPAPAARRHRDWPRVAAARPGRRGRGAAAAARAVRRGRDDPGPAGDGWRPLRGAGVLASAVGMDKEYMKLLFAARGLPVGPYVVVRDGDWDVAAPASGCSMRSPSSATRCSSSRPAAGHPSAPRAVESAGRPGGRGGEGPPARPQGPGRGGDRRRGGRVRRA